MKVVTAEQIREIDDYTISKIGIPGMILMDNAGRNVAEEIERQYEKKTKIAVFIGKGNNGGDGLVTTRYLKIAGYKVKIFLCFPKDDFRKTPLLNLNLQICKNLELPIIGFFNENLINENKHLLEKYDLIVDAILGTGINSTLKEPLSTIVSLINDLKKDVFSIDMPTGLYSDNTIVNDVVINAKNTVTFGLPKISQVLYPSKKFVGNLKVVNIGFPFEKIDTKKIKINLIDKEFVLKNLPERNSYFHKGDFGRVSVFAGSTGKTGAAILTSQSALRSGVGLVTLMCDKNLNNIFETALLEVMTEPVDLSGDYSETSVLLNNADVITAGPGISMSEEARSFLYHILKLNNKIIILDADALNIISKDLSLLQKNNNIIIMTPHIGEFMRLTNLTEQEIADNRLKVVCRFAKEMNVILVLKSSETVIADANGNVFINPIGNEGMATAGTGDVLTGIISGIVAQGVKQKKSIFNSVVSAVYVHSLAGDIAYKEQGSYSLIASDIIGNLNNAFKIIKND